MAGRKQKSKSKKGPLCLCGCGERANFGRRFINHHNGRVMSDETKFLLSVQNLGRPSPNKGNKYSAEVCARISRIQKKRHAKVPIEERQRIGRKSAEARRNFTPERDAEFRKSLSKAIKRVHKRRTAEEEQEIAKKISQSVTETWLRTPRKAKQLRSDKLSKSLRKYWDGLSDSEKDAVIEKRLEPRSPNKPEKLLMRYLKRFGFRYVGNGAFWVNRFNPDFVNTNKKIIVELFGVYWHAKDNPRDKKRIQAYKDAGYKVIVIWDTKLLKNTKEQVARVEKLFLRRNIDGR